MSSLTSAVDSRQARQHRSMEPNSLSAWSKRPPCSDLARPAKGWSLIRKKRTIAAEE